MGPAGGLATAVVRSGPGSWGSGVGGVMSLMGGSISGSSVWSFNNLFLACFIHNG